MRTVDRGTPRVQGGARHADNRHRGRSPQAVLHRGDARGCRTGRLPSPACRRTSPGRSAAVVGGPVVAADLAIESVRGMGKLLTSSYCAGANRWWTSRPRGRTEAGDGRAGQGARATPMIPACSRSLRPIRLGCDRSGSKLSPTPWGCFRHTADSWSRTVIRSSGKCLRCSRICSNQGFSAGSPQRWPRARSAPSAPPP